MIFYEGQLSVSGCPLSFAKITVFPDVRTYVRTDIGSEKLADVIGASRNNKSLKAFIFDDMNSLFDSDQVLKIIQWFEIESHFLID